MSSQFIYTQPDVERLLPQFYVQSLHPSHGSYHTRGFGLFRFPLCALCQESGGPHFMGFLSFPHSHSSESPHSPLLCHSLLPSWLLHQSLAIFWKASMCGQLQLPFILASTPFPGLILHLPFTLLLSNHLVTHARILSSALPPFILMSLPVTASSVGLLHMVSIILLPLRIVSLALLYSTSSRSCCSHSILAPVLITVLAFSISLNFVTTTRSLS